MMREARSVADGHKSSPLQVTHNCMQPLYHPTFLGTRSASPTERSDEMTSPFMEDEDVTGPVCQGGNAG